jgi:hypothetical protein
MPIAVVGAGGIGVKLGDLAEQDSRAGDRPNGAERESPAR